MTTDAATSDIEANRAAEKYRPSECRLRLAWSLGLPMFRLTPRPCFGLRRWLLRRYGAVVGEQVNTYPSSTIYFPWNLQIGDYSAVGEWALIYNLGPVTIGERCTISQRTHLCAGTHDYRDPAMPLQKLPIHIGSDAWVCADAFIGPGVSVGARAIVGARAVAVNHVAENAIVAGNPAKLIRTRD